MTNATRGQEADLISFTAIILFIRTLSINIATDRHTGQTLHLYWVHSQPHPAGHCLCEVNQVLTCRACPP